MPTFYEFFAGGGMARLGLGTAWKCEFANDISASKAKSYQLNFPAHEFALSDIKHLNTSHLPGNPDLVWGSFPCQDLSLAGSGAGLEGGRSGLIWNLLDLVKKLRNENRPAKLLVLENVMGLLNSRGGEDFYEILRALARDGFLFGTLLMDAVHFVPHSRPRVFLVAVDTNQVSVYPKFLTGRRWDSYPWTSSRLDKLWLEAPWELRQSWIWWNVPAPPKRTLALQDLIDRNAQDWDSPEYTRKLLGLMSTVHLRKVEAVASLGREVVGTLYRRTREAGGKKEQRVEVRFDGISGCLRTPSGGSSRQRLLFVSGSEIRSRLLSTREAARLMGVPEHYELPPRYNDGYQLAGDGVAVPVVNWLATQLLTPLLSSQGVDRHKEEAALVYA